MARTFEIAFELAARVNSSLNRSFSAASDKLHNMNRRISSVKASMRELEQAQKSGKISVSQYAREYEYLAAQLKRAEQAQERYAKAVNLQQRVQNYRRQARADMLGAVETAVALGAPVAAAIQFESAMADVKKVVNFETPEQFEQMQKDILELSKRIPMAADGIAAIVAAGGQSGIAREELIKFAESAAQMGVAFDITSEEAGEMMSQWRNAFKMNQAQVIELADKVNYLGNTTAASAPKISEVLRRIGPLGEVAGAAGGEIAALGATMISAGISEEIAATGIKNLMLNLVAGESATARQKAAFDELGLSAEQMAVMMKQDAQSAILTVLESLQQIPEHKQAAVLTDLFGRESVAAISPLLTNLEGLQENLQKVADESSYAGSMLREFEEQASTKANKATMLKNQVVALAVSIGDILLPPLSELMGVIGRVADKVHAFTEKHPRLTKAIVMGTASVLAFNVALSTLKYVGSAVVSPFVNMYAMWQKLNSIQIAVAGSTEKVTLAQLAWNKTRLIGSKLLDVSKLVLYKAKTIAVTVATKAWTAAQWLWNAAMSANPIGLMIVGIGALIGAGYLLIRNWNKVKLFFTNLWNNPKETLAAFANSIRSKFEAVFGWIGDKVQWFLEKWEKIREFFGFDGKSSTTATATDVGSARLSSPGSVAAHAEGGIFSRPHLAWFAEEGPEAVIPLDGSQRARDLWARTGALLGAAPSGSTVINVTHSPTINIHGSTLRKEVEKAEKALTSSNEDLVSRLKAIQRQERRVSFA